MGALYFLALLAAGVAQLVEHFLAKEDVASSSLVTRSNPRLREGSGLSLAGAVKNFSRRETAPVRSPSLAFTQPWNLKQTSPSSVWPSWAKT